MKATAKELRFHSKEILDAVSRGEEVVITFRGKPRAKLIPIGNTKPANESSPALFGIWKDNRAITDVDGYIRRIRKGRLQ